MAIRGYCGMSLWHFDGKVIMYTTDEFGWWDDVESFEKRAAEAILKDSVDNKHTYEELSDIL